MICPSLAVDDSDLAQVGRLVGTDEHREAIIDFIDEDRIVEGMHHVVVADAMLRALAAISGAPTATS